MPFQGTKFKQPPFMPFTISPIPPTGASIRALGTFPSLKDPRSAMHWLQLAVLRRREIVAGLTGDDVVVVVGAADVDHRVICV